MKPHIDEKTDFIIRKNRELTAILEVSRVLTTSFDLEKNISSVMSALGSLLEMQRGCVFLLDPLSGELRIVAAHGLTKENIEKGKYRIGEGIVGRVLEKKNPDGNFKYRERTFIFKQNRLKTRKGRHFIPLRSDRIQK